MYVSAGAASNHAASTSSSRLECRARFGRELPNILASESAQECLQGLLLVAT
jgi:hypothetical protein